MKPVSRIWYPGSAYANPEWIVYLKNTFPGLWYYSDTQDFEWDIECAPLNSKRLTHDTFDTNPRITNRAFDILIISFHPGLKTPQCVFDSKILEVYNPKVFLYANEWDISKTSVCISEGELFAEKSPYILERIEVLPKLNRLYSIYTRNTP
jgi:hypothetical protein